MNNWIEWLRVDVWGAMPELEQGPQLLLIALFFVTMLAALRPYQSKTATFVSRAKQAVALLICIPIAFALLLGALGSLTQFLQAALGYGNFGPDNPAHEAIRNIGLVLAAVFGAPFIAWRSYVAHKQTAIAEQSHITEQINTAVQGLGAEKSVTRRLHDGNGDDLYRLIDDQDGKARVPLSENVTLPNIEVRVGAIYALERIAQDSHRDHVQIMEILTAYIRENAPASSAQDFPEPEWESLPDDADETAREKHKKDRAERFTGFSTLSKAFKWAGTLKARTDIQTAMQVIARRSPAQIIIETDDDRYGEKGYRLDLRNANLQAIDIFGRNLTNALLQNARMEGANLSFAQMEGADLSFAWLNSETDFTDATLRGASVKSVDFTPVALSQDQVTSMFGDKTTLIPNGTTRPDTWPTVELDGKTFIEEWEKFLRDPDGYSPPPAPRPMTDD